MIFLIIIQFIGPYPVWQHYRSASGLISEQWVWLFIYRNITWHMVWYQGPRWTFCCALKYWMDIISLWHYMSLWSWQKIYSSIWNILVLKMKFFYTVYTKSLSIHITSKVSILWPHIHYHNNVYIYNLA